jgi:hypothetical protein
MEFIFDLQRLKHKLLISFVLWAVFSVLYTTFPPEEFNNKNNDLVDSMFLSATIQTGFKFQCETNSIRAKTLMFIHLALAYTILLM